MLDTVITVTPERRHDLIESCRHTKPTAQSHWLPLRDHFLVRRNHFKAVNDDFGHPAGDAVLAATAVRLTAWAGPPASVGRLGGDEFFSELLTFKVWCRGGRPVVITPVCPLYEARAGWRAGC
ncbi:diguanylate cyclase [Streptomyces sp. SID4946]|nr:diguanylate cyclase [Streptomyces sp. SID4946]